MDKMLQKDKQWTKLGGKDSGKKETETELAGKSYVIAETGTR